MPRSCKCILDTMVFKGAMTKEERDKILRNIKTDTCKNVGEDYAEFDQFVCSKCGIELQDWNRVERCDDGEIIYHEYTFQFCPHCGRRIVEGSEEG